MTEEYLGLLKKYQALEYKAKLQRELPHLYAFPEYKWAVEFRECNNRLRFLTAANQVGKSSTLIRDVIEKACNKELWPKFFPNREPTTFWYIYPDGNKVEEEFHTKWQEFLPKGEAKEKGPYAWRSKIVKNQRILEFIESGVRLTFKTWGSDLQSGTVDYIGIDEELPSDLWPEILFRVQRYNGMISMVFTATLNQQFWYEVMEKRGDQDESMPEAAKWQISMEYDCKVYADGSPSPWTDSNVTRVKNSCGTQTEIDRRVHGRFVSEEGLKYPSFNEKRNTAMPTETPSNWSYYSGVDVGSGGQNHPAAISVIAVNPEYNFAKLVIFWIGNEQEITTSGDILIKYRELTKGLVLTGEFYDSAAKDFGTLAERHGYAFQLANKKRGEDLLNVLFKNQMLTIEKGELTYRLVTELRTLKVNADKTKAKDDGIDSLRYATSSVPFDLTNIKSDILISLENEELEKEKKKNTYHGRRTQIVHEDDLYEDELEELETWSQMMEGY